MRLLRFSRADGTWSLESLGNPWGDAPSLYSFLLGHGADREEGLGPAPPELPDHGQKRPPRFGPEAMGGLAPQRRGAAAAAEVEDEGDTPERMAARLVHHIAQLLDRSEPETLAAVLEELQGEDALTALDAILAELARRPFAHPDRARTLARFLATTAAERNPVQLGMALLGVFGAEDDEAQLLTLGRHDDLTLVAVVALQHLSPQPEAAIFRLARSVWGWGRIHAVKRLAETRSRAIRRWLLLEGYRNTVMIEHTALVAARSGGLTQALRAVQASGTGAGGARTGGAEQGAAEPGLLAATGEILEALIRGVDGPAEGIDQWEEGAEAVELWLRVLEGAELSPQILATVQTVQGFIRDEDEPWSEYAEHGWTAERIQAIERMAAKELGRDEARTVIQAALEIAGDPEFSAAVKVASAVGIDPWPSLMARLLRGEARWSAALATEDWGRAEQVVALAEARLPLDTLELGSLISELERFPGLGWKLLGVALKSPLVALRARALSTLAAWGASRWGPEVRPALERAVFTERDEAIKESLKRLLAGRPLAPSSAV